MTLWVSGVVAGCTSDKDCSFAGICADGVCDCEKPFNGSSCQNLALQSHGCEQGLCLAGESTWGGGIERDSSSGDYHMYAALMGEDCTLDAWLTNSRVVHASTPDLDTGFTALDIALGPLQNQSRWDSLTQHNPTVVRAPDGTWLIYYMGNHPVKGSHAANCSQGQAGNVRAPPPEAAVQRVGLATASNPQGPWTRRDDPIIEPGARGSWDDLFTTNPTAHIFPNGSALVLYKGRSVEQPNDMFTGVARAEHWSGPYTKFGSRPIANVPTNCEDAGIFYGTKTQRFFAIFHCGCAYLTVWSSDGLSWNANAPVLPWCDLALADGSHVTLRRRERPQFILDAQGIVVGMTNGVEPPSSLHGGRVFTMLSLVV